jgi:hypothetical protein
MDLPECTPPSNVTTAAPAGRRAWKHTPTPVRAPHQPRRPDQSGLSREELRKIVTDLLG